MVEEDRRLAQEGLVPLMNGEGETRHKHVDELKPADVTDRVRAEDAILDWLVSRTENRLEQSGLWLPKPTSTFLTGDSAPPRAHAVEG